jgi:hypothetical protein
LRIDRLPQHFTPVLADDGSVLDDCGSIFRQTLRDELALLCGVGLESGELGNWVYHLVLLLAQEFRVSGCSSGALFLARSTGFATCGPVSFSALVWKDFSALSIRAVASNILRATNLHFTNINSVDKLIHINVQFIWRLIS